MNFGTRQGDGLYLLHPSQTRDPVRRGCCRGTALSCRRLCYSLYARLHDRSIDPHCEGEPNRWVHPRHSVHGVGRRHDGLPGHAPRGGHIQLSELIVLVAQSPLGAGIWPVSSKVNVPVEKLTVPSKVPLPPLPAAPLNRPVPPVTVQ